MARWHIGALALCVVSALSSANCAGCRAEDPETARIKATTLPTYDTKTGKLSRLTADLNKNGKIDTWTYMDGARIIRSERDRNEDGKIDYWEYNLPDGKGGIEHVEEDTNGDGIPDKWDFYANGSIHTTEWDDTHNGVRNRRWTYGPGGTVVSVETEPDGRGGYLKKVAVAK